MLVIGVLLALVSTTMVKVPSMFSTVEVAVAKGVHERVLDFAGKRGLARYLTGERRAEVKFIKVEGEKAWAAVKVLVPVSPAQVDEGQEQLRSELDRYLEVLFERSSDGRLRKLPFVAVNVTLKLERSGLAGWRVVGDEDLARRLNLAQRAFNSHGDVEVEMLVPSAMPRNAFDLLAFAGTNSFAAMQWVLALTVCACALVWGRNGGGKVLAMGSILAGWNLFGLFLVTMG